MTLIRRGRAIWAPLRRRFSRKRLRVLENRVFRRVTKDKLIRTLRDLGLGPGDTVCVHSSLSRLGYVVGGADTLIDAVIEVVGEQGTVLMPTFSMSGSMRDYLAAGNVFDVRSTPSRVGQVTEAFRMRSDTIRSLHPTNSLAGWGRDAEWLLADHERSPTPYGADTPYGRLVDIDRGFILMVDTHVQSLLHHLQERVELPHLFLDDPVEARLLDEQGRTRTVRTRVMRPRTSYFIAIPGADTETPDWALIQDFALLFPARRRRIVAEAGYEYRGYPVIHRRQHELERSGILQTAPLHSAEIGLLHAGDFIRYIEPELRGLVERFRGFYDPGRIEELNLRYA